MIPIAPDLGLTETYGTTSILSIDIQNGKLQLKEPTITDRVRCLKIRKQSMISIYRTPKQEAIDVFNEGIAKNRPIELLSKNDVFDPCVGTLVEISKISENYNIVFTAGSTNSILVMGKLNNVNGKIKFTKHKVLKMKNEIKQIKVVKVTNFKIILIRTVDELHLLKQHNSIVTKLFNFKIGKNWTKLAYAEIACFLEVGFVKLSVIDQIGKFCVWKAEIDTNGDFASDFTDIDLLHGSIYDPLDMSNFKKLVWLDENRLILFSRTQLHEYNFIKETLKCRISAGIWSKLLDLVSNKSKTLYYMLTSKELIVIDTAMGKFRRKYAWKHYFNDIDTSMYLTAAEYKNEELCIVTSKQIPVSYVFRFPRREFRIIDSPNIFLPATNEPIQSLVLEIIDSELLMLQRVECGTSACFVDFENGITDTKIDKVNEIFQKKEKLELSSDTIKELLKCEKYYKFAESKMPSPTEITAQIYQKLDMFVQSKSTQITLFQVTFDLHIPRRVENVSKIVEYIVRNNKEKHFDIFINKESWMTDNKISKKVEATPDTLEEHLQFLREYIPNMDMVVFYLFLGSIEICKTEQTLELGALCDGVEMAEEELDENIQEVLQSFENDFDVVGIYDSDKESDDDIGNDTFSNIWSIPTIGLSQSQTQVTSKSKIKKGPRPKATPKSNIFPKGGVPSSSQQNYTQVQSSPASYESQLPSSQPPLSQTFSQRFSQLGSQSQKPKKKKRKGGFS